MDTGHIDFDKWRGKTAKIGSVVFLERTTKLHKEKKLFVKIHTEVLETIDGSDITASRLFEVKSEDKWKPLGRLQEVLDHYKVPSPYLLIGAEVRITVKEKPRRWLEWQTN